MNIFRTFKTPQKNFDFQIFQNASRYKLIRENFLVFYLVAKKKVLKGLRFNY